jgi:pimeloyl-ACP methyl ester carboxylesterase
MKKWQIYFLSLCLFTILTACNRSESPDKDIKVFTEQEVVWGACDNSLVDFSFLSPEILAKVQKTLERVECATLKTPLDWKNPSLDKVDLGVLRVKAKDTAKRKGAIAMNPGGPGGDGLGLALSFGILFDNPVDFGFSPEDTYKQITAEYDLIGFSPRGVGGSFKLFCGTNLTAPVPSFYTDRSQENLDAILKVSERVAQACQRSPLSKYIDTEQTAKDMDLIRILLGDKKLNYLGFSYGSWLGAWYAKLFPDNVGNFVLDSNTDFSSAFSRTFELQPASFQEAFDKIVVPYLSRNSTLFELGSTEAEVKAVYATLPEEIKAGVTFPIVGSLYTSAGIQEIATFLLAARGLNAVYQEDKALVLEDFEAFLSKLATHTYHSDSTVNEIVSSIAFFLASDLQFYLTRDTAYYNFDLSDDYSVFTSILCNDGEWNKDKNYWIQKGNEENIANPLIGGNLTEQPCIYWSKSTAKMPSVPSNIPPILLVQSEFDTATNTDGALAAFNSLPNAKMVFVEDEYTHGIFPYATECVDAPVAAFLLNGTLPTARQTNCAGKPLPGEEGTALQSLAVKKEKTLLDHIHEIIRRNAIKPLGMHDVDSGMRE